MCAAGASAPARRDGGNWRATAHIGGSTVVIAALGWLTLVIVARTNGPSAYAQFAVLWAVAYMVAGILSGLQQETARLVSTELSGGGSTTDSGMAVSSAVRGSVSVCLAMSVLVLASSAVWGPTLLGDGWGWQLVPLILGLFAVAGFLVVRGVLASHGDWAPFAMLGIGDATVRLVAVVAASLWVTSDTMFLWAIVSGWLVWLPFARWGGRLSPARRRAQRESTRSFVRGSLHAVTATACMSLVIAGFPFLVRITGDGGDSASAGILFAALLITRTPLLLPINGFQLALITHFVRLGAEYRVALLRLLAVILIGGAVFCVLSFLIGPEVLRLLMGQDFDISRSVFTVIAVGAVLMLIAIVLGLVLLASSRHHGYTAGWLVTATVTVTCLLLPLPVVERSLWALCVAPTAGILSFSAALARPSDG